MDNFLSNFDRNKILMTKVYLSGEEGFYESYKNHLTVSKELRDINKQELIYVANSELLIAVECFLKDVYCNIRFEIALKKGGLISLVDASFFEIVDQKTIEKKLNSEISCKGKFNHNLISVCDFIKDKIPSLKMNANFSSFSSALPTDPNWIESRYKDTSLLKNSHDFKSYDKLYAAFDLILKNELGNFK